MAVLDAQAVTGNPPILSKRLAFTPSFNSGVNDVASSRIGYYWQEGEHFCADVTVVLSAASSAAAVTFSMPSISGQQLTINSSVLSGGGNTSNAEMTRLGTAEWFDSGTAWKVITPHFFGSTLVRFNESPGILASNQLAAGDSLRLLLKIPVYEWR